MKQYELYECPISGIRYAKVEYPPIVKSACTATVHIRALSSLGKRLLFLDSKDHYLDVDIGEGRKGAGVIALLLDKEADAELRILEDEAVELWRKHGKDD